MWVPIPGFSPEGKDDENAHGFAPRLQWCQFASSKPLEDRYFSLYTKTSTRRVRGAILVGVEWTVPEVSPISPIRASEEIWGKKKKDFGTLDDSEATLKNSYNDDMAPMLPEISFPLSARLGGVGDGYDTIHSTTIYKSPMKVIFIPNIPIYVYISILLVYCCIPNGRV